MSGFSPASPPPEQDVEGQQLLFVPDCAIAVPAPVRTPGTMRSRFRGAREFILYSRWTECGCRYLLAALFLLAAISKITDLLAFVDRLVIHSPLPVPVAQAVGMFLPWLELSCAFCLLLKVYRRESATILAGLLVLFIGYGFLLPAESNCGCFILPQTVEHSAVLSHTLPRNLFFLACAIRIFLDRPAQILANPEGSRGLVTVHPR